MRLMPSLPLPDEFPLLDLGEYVLRRIEPRDAAAYDKYRADFEVTRYTSIDVANEPAALVFPMLEKAFAEKRSIRWAISPKATGVMAGDCGFFEINVPHARAEIGYVIAREHWGRGVGTSAVRTMVRWGFEALDLHRIEAIIHPKNLRSIQIARKSGFGREGTIRGRTLIRGAYQDMELFGLLRDEWSAQAGVDSHSAAPVPPGPPFTQ
jgi:ribosomal-protein-alanine N-acetyltransferase